MTVSKEEYVQRGNEFREQGELDAAILQYRKAIQKDGAYGEAYLLLGRAYRGSEQAQEAYVALAKAVELLPNNGEAKAELGDLALSGYLADRHRPRRLYETASEMAAALQAADPASFEGLRIQGYLAMAEPNAELASELFRKALAANPGGTDVAAALIQCLIALDKGEEAESRALSLIQANPGYGPVYDILYGRYRAQGREEDARELLRLKIANNPGVPFYSIELAEMERSLGNEAGVESVIASLLSAEPAAEDAYREAADFFGRAGEWPRAVETYRAGLEAGNGDRQALRKGLARAYMETGETAKSEELLATVLEQSPDDRDARLSQAALMVASGKPTRIEAGVAGLRALVEGAPEDVALRYHLGRALAAAGRSGEARQELQQVLGLESSHLGALQDLAAIAIVEQDAGLALEYAERALAIEPGQPSVRLIRTAAWALQGRHSEVRSELARLSRDYPAAPEVQLQLALLELDEGNLDEAARRFEALRNASSRDVRAVKGLAAVHLGRDEPARALSLLEKELQLQPDSPELLDLYATTAENAGRFAEAIQALKRLESLGAVGDESVIRLARLHQSLGEHGTAAGLLEEAARRNPDDALATAMLGSVYWEMGERDRSIATYRVSLASDPSNLFVINNLAFALAEGGADLSEARSLADRAVRESPDNPYCVDTLGFVYLKQGQVDSALQAFNRAVAQSPQTPQFRVHLAMALMAQGDDESARSELTTALALDQSGREAQEIHELLNRLGPAARSR